MRGILQMITEQWLIDQIVEADMDEDPDNYDYKEGLLFAYNECLAQLRGWNDK